MRSNAYTPEQYLAELPEERREVVAFMRELILHHLPPGYDESMRWGMLSYEVPLERYRTTYNGEPLSYAALAAQKNHYALYLMGLYCDPRLYTALEARFRADGKKFDMGKSCLRFRALDRLPLDAIGAAIAAVPVERFIECYEASRSKRSRRD
jgi:hypothetical protein